jgi:hypothetical protein
MPKPFRQWTVLPHDKLVQLDENLLFATGKLPMPLGEVERRMTVARLPNGDLVVYSAIALDESEMRELEAFGRPRYLVVPSAIHRMDAKIWKDRYPTMTVIAPAGARERVEQVVGVDRTAIDFGDPSVELVIVPGTGDREAALVVTSPSGRTLVVSDLIFNMRGGEGVKGWLFKALGFAGPEPRLPLLVKLREVKDQPALRGQLEAWSHLPRLRRIVVSHGTIIETEPARVLESVAHALAA